MQGHRPARGQPGRLGHRLRRDLARGGAGPQGEAGRRLHGRRGRLRRLLHRHGRATRSWPSPAPSPGSIGVFGGKFSLRGLYDKIGITKEILTRGQQRGPLLRVPAVGRRGAREVPRAHGRRSTSDFVHEGGRGPQEVLRGGGRRGPGPRVDGRRGAAPRPRGPARRPRRRAGPGQGAGEDRRRTRKCTSWSLPERKGLLETLLERQEEEVGESACCPASARRSCAGRGCLGDGQLAARLPFDLQDPLTGGHRPAAPRGARRRGAHRPLPQRAGPPAGHARGRVRPRLVGARDRRVLPARGVPVRFPARGGGDHPRVAVRRSRR